MNTNPFLVGVCSTLAFIAVIAVCVPVARWVERREHTRLVQLLRRHGL